MKRNLMLLGLLGMVMPIERGLATIVIDSFMDAQGPLQRVAPVDDGTSISSSAPGAGIIGLERDITVSLVAGGPGGNRINIVVTPFQSYNHSQDGGIRGSSDCVWDGVDNSPAINFTGLAPLDLTESGTQSTSRHRRICGFGLGSLVFTVYTDASNSSTFTQGFPATATNDVYVIPYASFTVASGTGADFTNVGAIRMLVDGTTVPGLDVILDRIDTTPQLTVAKTDALFVDVDLDGNVDVGDRIKYTIVITNPDDDGNLAAPGVVFTDTPDPSTTLFVPSVTTTQGTVTTGNGGGDTSVEVNVGNIADGASVTITFEVTITAEDPLVCNQGFAGTIPSDDPETPAPLDPTCTPVTFCGDGIVNDVTEECDDGNMNDNDDCSNNCTMGCGNEIINTGEFCDGMAEASGVDCTLPCRMPGGMDECTCCGDDVLQPGSSEQCDGTVFEPGAPASHGPCRGDCTFCGDGIVNGGEECDDGNANDNDNCTNACNNAECGDGIVDMQPPGVEQCDDGNMDNNDNCTNACTTAVCGDGIVDSQPPGVEQCDDGNMNNNDNCTNACTTAICGDGIVDSQPPGVEQCDDGNMNNNDNCTNACTTAICGDGIVDSEPPGVEQCDDGNMNNNDNCTNACTTAGCGDGIVDSQPPGVEQCDDGNMNNNDNCTNACTTAVCGDGIVDSQPPGVEQCDDGNMNNNDNCTNACTTAVCGDGIVDSQPPGVEQCDDGDLINNDECTNACTLPNCGDSIVQPPEQCDDGNMNNNDACSNICMNARCGDGILQAGEQCDDGNLTAGDGCSPICRNEVCGNNFLDPGEECDGTADAACTGGEVCASDCTCQIAPPNEDIPTVSEWGLAVLALLLLTGAKLHYSGRPNSRTTLAG